MQLPIQFTAARSTDPSTSQANKDAFVKKVSQRDALLITYYNSCMFDTYVSYWGLTDEEAGRYTTWKDSTMYDLRICYWKRCSELRKLGYIKDTGHKRESLAFQLQQVCCITEEGIDYVEKMLYE